MNRKLQRRGPIGLARSPKSGARDRRSSDVSSGYLQVADAVPDVSLSPIALNISEQALTGIVKRMKTLQDAHNALLFSLRNGQVINR